MIKDLTKVSISFFVKGEGIYASRSWPSVPRKGDEVMLFNKGAGKTVPYRIIRVVWGVEGPDGHDLGMQAVNLEIKQIK